MLLTASNLYGSALQVLAISVQGPAGLSSGKPPAATTGRHYSFTVTTYGYPVPSITESGALPTGLTFTSKGDGKAVLSGVPKAGSGGLHSITVTVSNSLGKAVGHYSLAVGQAPTITSAASASAVYGKAFSFTVKTAGYPHPSLTHSSLPAGLKWANNGNGTATISGIPGAKDIGIHHITITASNSSGKNSQVLKLTVS
ncbi:MAG TPA: putative Ig domain-containing protein [Acidimicrobiales bacterium]|nr:putative Ig domain-containing protein [Acidimicrobiales bacterium]